MARNSIHRKFLPVFLFLLGFQSALAADVISYTGRLVNSNGSPVTGPVNIKIDLFYSGNLSSLKCTKSFGNVPLRNGVFHINIDYASGDCGAKPFSQIVQEIPDNETMVLSVTDESHSKTYSHHAVQAVPLSMLSGAAKTLVAPPTGTPAGHVLKWNGSAWEAAADGGGAGTVTGITAGTGINVTQNVNDYTVSISNGGVTNSQLANGIDRTKLAAGTPNQIVANDALGVMTSISVLPLGMGGTGATSAADARTNLGLGTAATADIGIAASNVLSASGINTCQPWEKLSFNLAPVVGWTCVNEYSDTTKLSLTGGTMTGAIDMSNNKITNLGTPTVGTDAATKAYVDSAASAASTSVWSLSGSDVFRTAGKVGIGTNTPQAVLDITSTTSGVLVPRMTTAERDGISSPSAGMVLYNTTTNKLNFYDTAWKEVGVSGAGITSINIGTGLTPSGAFASGGTIAIAAGGVSNTELANSAVNDSKVAAGANIARSKLASGTANHVLINDASGVMSSEASLAITRGGTGLTANGTANQIVGMNNAAGAMEYKNIVGGTGVSVAHSPNTITVSATGAPPTGAAGGDLTGSYPNPTLNTVPVSKGGTGLTSLTPRGVLSGNSLGSGVVGTACASGQYLGFNVSGDPTCYNVSNITATSFVNGGNDFGGDATLGTNGAGQALNFETAGATKMTIDSTGNVGIGTASPGSKLDVNGDINIKGYVTSTTPSGYLTFAGSGNHSTGYIYLGSDNKLHLSGFANTVKIDSGFEPGTISYAVNFQYGDVTFSKAVGVDTYLRSAGQDLRLQPAAGYNIQLAPSTGSVGVGTPTPNEKLTIEGAASLKELAASPTATANYGKLYVKSADSKLYFMNDAGVETALGTPTAGSVDSSAITDGSIVDADVSGTANIAQSKIANLTTDLAAKQPLDAELTAVAGLSTDGIMVKNGAGSVITRTIVGAAGRTFVSNGNGATGNPTVDISNGLLPSPVLGDAGKFLKATGADTSSWQALAAGDITTALGFTPINKATDTINSGTFTFGGSSVVRVLDPILPTDVANRQWVESQIAAGSGFVNNGNDFGGNAVLGTNGAGQTLDFETAGTTKVTIAADGKVGIGVTAPEYLLHLRQNGTSQFGLESFGGIPGIYTKKANGTTAAPTPVLNNNVLMELAVVGYGTTNYITTSAAKIMMAAEEDWTDATGAAGLRFHTRQSGSLSSSLERMRITASGNVGIGTITPNANLQVNQSVGASTKGVIVTRFGSPHGAGGGAFNSYFTGGTEVAPVAPITGDIINSLNFFTAGTSGTIFSNPSFSIRHTLTNQTASLSNVDTSFMVNTTTTGVPFNAMTLQGGTGNVVIGTTSPNEKLTVEGNVSLKEGAVPTLTAGYGKLYVNSTDSKLYFMNDSGTSVELGSSTPAAGSITSSHIADGTIVDADVSASAAIAQSKIANLTTDLAAKQPLDAELTAIAGLATNGIVVKTGAGTATTRSIAGVANRTTVSNVDGVGGNPTIDVSTSLLPSPAAGGTFLKSTAANSAAWSALASGDITTALGFTPINKAGDTIASGTLTFNGTGILALSYTPTNLTDAVNKQYVDSQIGSVYVQNGNSFGANAVLGTNTAHSLAFETNGTNRMTIGSTGNIGIGVANPGAVFEVYNNGTTSVHLRPSGQTAPNLINGRSLRLGTGNALDFGEYAGGTPWIQAQSFDYTSQKEILLNPLGGNVGIGTDTTTRAKLEVIGSIISAPAAGTASSTKDFANGNIQYSTANCGAYALHNLKDGGSYTFIVQGTTAATCSFTAFSGAGVTPLTVHLPPDHGATTAGKHTVYSIIVAGTHAYFAWVPGM